MSKAVRAVQVFALAVGLCTVAYAAYVVVAWSTYGHPSSHAGEDVLLDRFMPVYDIREERHIRVNAPAAVTLQAARRVSLNDSLVVRAIFKARELILRERPQAQHQQRAFVDLAQSIGWRVLANEPGREVVFGAVTQPWKADVVFRGIAPAQFASFNEPDYVKIVWTFRADPVRASSCVFRTETRAIATDANARTKFRRYWSAYSPGIVLIRLGALRLVKAEAERRISTSTR